MHRLILIGLIGLCLPCLAEEPPEQLPECPDTPAFLRVQLQAARFRDGRGAIYTLPIQSYALSAPVLKRLRLEARFDQGNSAETHLSNLDLGLAYRLGGLDPQSHDPLNNLHLALDWSTFSSRSGASAVDDRDEGLGLGLERLASPEQELSYYYRVMFHPSLGGQSRNLLGGQALLLEGGMSLQLNSSFFVDLGYRFRSHKHGGSEDARTSSESGPLLGVRVRF